LLRQRGKPNTGHHHLLIDTTLTAEQMKGAIPADNTHKHFDAGQTETMVTLPKGKHTLQLVVGDWSHTPACTGGDVEANYRDCALRRRLS
jgi:Domain of unknown function (DUF4399)